MGIELDNRTPWAASLSHGFLDARTKVGFVYARCTWQWEPLSGTVVPAPVSWPLFDKPLKTKFGVFAADWAAWRRGCEIVIAAKATSRRPVHELDARVSAGGFQRTIRLIGDRRWVRGAHALVPSAPESFQEMDIAWERAYGGATISDGVTVEHPLNPSGRGFYMSEEEAAGGLLPNIEDPEARITKWSDMPLPVGFGPVENALPWCAHQWIHARSSSKIPTADEVAAAAGGWSLGTAPPGMVAPALDKGDRLVAELGDTRFGFEVPHRSLGLTAHIGRVVERRKLRLVGVWALLDEGLIVTTYFCSFRYSFVEHEERRVFLAEDEA